MTAKLPGRPRPQAEARQEFEERRADFMQRCTIPSIADVLVNIHVGKTQDMHRWRVRLDCGHIREVLTRGKDTPPEEIKWGDYLLGEYPCNEKGCYRHVTRDIVSWDEPMELVTAPDPVDPPADWEGDADLWAVTRRDHPLAHWKVTLTCGHQDQTATDGGWKPEDGIRRRPPEDDEQRARCDDLIALYSERGGFQDEESLRYVREDFPKPTPWTTCYTCAWGRKITAHKYVGPLVTPQRKPRQAPDARTVLQRRLSAAEREAADLRKQLAALDHDEPEP